MLTKEQEKTVEESFQNEMREATKTNVAVDLDKAREIVQYLYKNYLDIDNFTNVEIVDSPQAAFNEIKKRMPDVDNKTLADNVSFISLFTYWTEYYHFGIHKLNEKSGVPEDLIENLDKMKEICHQIHAILPTDEVCYVIKHPKKISIKDGDFEKFIFHSDEGYAIEYADGLGWGYLNDVKVPDYIALNKPEDIDVEKVMAETNVDVQREAINKIGSERFFEKINPKILDEMMGSERWENYQLLKIKFADKSRIFLKMKNPSSGKYTIERVTDGCKTVRDALVMRASENEKTYKAPLIIT